jgi:acetyl-CoA acetyltransferase
MTGLRKPVFLAAGAYTVSMGSGRKEFDPRKSRPGLEHYINEAVKAVLAQIPDPNAVDEGVIANFMAARFNRQGNLAALLAAAHPALRYKPMVRVEGACGSGGLGLATGIKSVLADVADVVLVLGVEVQNTVKAMYGADILAGAGHYASERKKGEAYFFPAKFSERAAAYYARYGAETTRKAMAAWYANAITNARLNPLAQEYHNTSADPTRQGMAKPDPDSFTECLNYFDCSKVSDGAAAILVCSEEGLAKLGLARNAVCRVSGYGQVVDDLTQEPPDLTTLTTSGKAAERALAQAGLAAKDVGVLEVHDCFSITGILAVEALGLAEPGKGPELVLGGAIARGGAHPTNTSGGLIGYGHATGASGVRMAVDLLNQLTGKAGDFQITPKTPTGLLITMGGNDKTVVSVAVTKA